MKTADRLIKARVQLLLDKPFFGNQALHLKLERNDSFPTLSTDGKYIYYNEDFVSKLSDKDLQFIFCHEIYHNVFYHLTRRQGRNAMRWNLAVDYAVNCILYKECGYVPEGGLYDKQFEDMTAEAIYNALPEGDYGENGYGSGEPQDGDDKQGNGKGKTLKNDKMTIKIGKDGKVEINGKQYKSYDVHKDIQGTKSEIEDIEKEQKIQTIKAYQQSKIAGKTPAGFDIFIEELLEAKLDWRSMMKQFVVSVAKTDFRWNCPNKRYVHRGLFLPSLRDESLGDIVVIADNSGSCVEYQQKFFSETNGLLQQYDVNMHLIVCDMEIQDYQEYHKGDEIKKNYKGAGGTDLRVAFDEIAKRGIMPSVIVVLTDGETPYPEKCDYPTLWVLTPDGVKDDRVPFGQIVRMDRDVKE